MDFYTFWLKFLTPAGVIVPWFLPNIDWKYKLYLVLFVVLISAVVYILHLRRQLKEQQKELDTTKENHRALANRFEEKQNELARYHEAFNSINYLITATVQSSGKDRLNTLYDYFLKIRLSLASDNKEGE